MAKNNDTQFIYQRIKSMINQGAFAAGERLNQLQLAEKLNVSRTPVATALHILAAEGYLYQKHNSGFYVRSITLEEVLELLLARASLESAAAYDIAENANKKSLDELEKAFSLLESQSLDSRSRVNFFEVDHGCHKALLESCKNTWILRMNDNMKILEHPHALGMLREPKEVLDEHREIIDAVIRRDAYAAQQAMLTHILHTRNIVAETARSIEKLGLSTTQLFQFGRSSEQQIGGIAR